jgi:hypothetical protein
MSMITPDQFAKLAQAATDAVCRVEGWCDDHPTMRPLARTDGQPKPSPTFRAELRRQLLNQGVRIARI